MCTDFKWGAGGGGGGGGGREGGNIELKSTTHIFLESHRGIPHHFLEGQVCMATLCETRNLRCSINASQFHLAAMHLIFKIASIKVLAKLWD